MWGGDDEMGKLWWWAAIPGWYCGLVVWLREREKGGFDRYLTKVKYLTPVLILRGVGWAGLCWAQVKRSGRARIGLGLIFIILGNSYKRGPVWF